MGIKDFVFKKPSEHIFQITMTLNSTRADCIKSFEDLFRQFGIAEEKLKKIQSITKDPTILKIIEGVENGK